jgi:5-methyltetrahydropteroyltriglutamate--homocysteine methyltransferase
VGSYPQPDWLIDRKRLREIVPPRAHARDLWRVDPPWLDQAQDDATLLAIRDQERAGIDVITDGEMRRPADQDHHSRPVHHDATAVRRAL